MALKQPICGIVTEGPFTSQYVLSEDYTYRFGGCDITVPEGFIWDGASAPIRSGIRKDGLIRAAALIHDYLYRNGGRIAPRVVLSRKQVDGLFRMMMREAGMSWWKAKKAYLAVQWFGWLAWNKHKRNRKPGSG